MRSVVSRLLLTVRQRKDQFFSNEIRTGTGWLADIGIFFWGFYGLFGYSRRLIRLDN